MAFDPCEHQKVEIIKRVAILRRKELGLPEERNITILYNEMIGLLGLAPVKLSSRIADHLPLPSEMVDAEGKFTVPNKICPECGRNMFLSSICQSCTEAEGGKFKSGYTCDKKGGGCGRVDEKTDEWIAQRLRRMRMEVPTGTKEELGIMTLTDDGLK